MAVQRIATKLQNHGPTSGRSYICIIISCRLPSRSLSQERVVGDFHAQVENNRGANAIGVGGVGACQSDVRLSQQQQQDGQGCFATSARFGPYHFELLTGHFTLDPTRRLHCGLVDRGNRLAKWDCRASRVYCNPNNTKKPASAIAWFPSCRPV